MLKHEYKKEIVRMLDRTTDIALIDLIYRLLKKSM